MRSSIIELCSADHHGDPQILARWLENKTADNVVRWLDNPRNTLLVADRDGEVLAAGCLTTASVITLNYVSPSARFQGASSALLAAMENRAQRMGHSRVWLDSTTTARRFYERRGYALHGPAGWKFGITAWHMEKSI